MPENPEPQRPSRLRAFWNARSRKGKAALIAGAVFIALAVIGYAAPSSPDVKLEDEPAAAGDEQAPTEHVTAGDTTTQAETKTESAPRPVVLPVTDGDTLVLDNGDRIRLVQIDAPERKGECYGRQAGTVLRHLLPVGTAVRVVRDSRLDNIDRYGRKLRYIFRGKRNINLVLVQKGASSVWFFDGDQGRFAGQLVAAANAARAAKRGAWGACEASYDFLSAWTTKAKVKKQGTQSANCHPSYKGACLDPNASDYDCAGGSGNGPKYTGPVTVVGYDEYGLDADGDGVGCET
jgi:endonuclease YncB( thermonuclease family)